MPPYAAPPFKFRSTPVVFELDYASSELVIYLREWYTKHHKGKNFLLTINGASTFGL